MINEVHKMTRIKRPLYSTAATWVKQSWEDIDVELIKTSFKCCGISLAGDDQESNWLFNTDQLYNGQDIEITNLNDVETNSEDNVKCEYNNDWGINELCIDCYKSHDTKGVCNHRCFCTRVLNKTVALYGGGYFTQGGTLVSALR